MTTTISGDDGIDRVKLGSITQESFAPNVAGNRPCFSAYQSVAQVSSTAWAKVLFQTKQYDATGDLDATGRFQPKVPGYYQLNGSVAAGSAAAQLVCAVFVNGLGEKAGPSGVGPVFYQTTVSAQVYLNGTTDYAELWASSSVAQNWQASKQGTYFQGFLARSAT